MYDYIEGAISSISPTQAVVDVSGVGYLLSISLQTYEHMEAEKRGRFFVQLVVREDAMLLYGFATEVEREMFRLLLSVSGIGASTARVMLSAYKTEELAGFISVGNVVAVKSIKGIGTKTAERVIIDLKDKMVNLSGLKIADISDMQSAGDGMINGIGSKDAQQAIDALLVLGYTKLATQKAVKSVCAKNPEYSLEQIIRAALQLL